jgi:hypothetical protein
MQIATPLWTWNRDQTPKGARHRRLRVVVVGAPDPIGIPPGAPPSTSPRALHQCLQVEVVGTLNSPDITPQGDPPLMLNHLYSISSAKLHEHQCIAHVVAVAVDALQLSGSHS